MYCDRTVVWAFIWIELICFSVIFPALVQRHNVNYIIHLASLLSAVGERNPQLAMKLNVRCVLHKSQFIYTDRIYRASFMLLYSALQFEL